MEFSNRKLSRTDKSLLSDIVTKIYQLEHTIWLGLLLCLNSLLNIFTILPLNTIQNPKFSNTFRCLLILTVSVLLSYFYPASRLYHDLKEQDFVKLSALYNMVGIADQLLMAYGKFAIKTLFASSWKMGTKITNFLVTLIYLFLHTLHQNIALTVFEVAIHSSTSTLVLVLVTSAFVEVKITVFKKTDHRALYQIVCNDFIDRLQLFTYLLTILIKAMIVSRSNIYHIMTGILLVSIDSIMIDWIKHYFILHFNKISPEVYEEFRKKNMRENFLLIQNENYHIDYEEMVPNCLDACSSVALAYRYTALPHACMLLRVFGGDIYQTLSCLEIGLAMGGLYLVKCIVTSIIQLLI
ncbi:unnamed protein product [Blepharisma stoltei]|uniref:Gustatory receptor n=1 Tax=Blepharisma stoltei TaxID=1481888 RepID=A0AAU9J650_9CILI|nr:unnamed protein product [Blepharisma stoltei]